MYFLRFNNLLIIYTFKYLNYFIIYYFITLEYYIRNTLQYTSWFMYFVAF